MSDFASGFENRRRKILSGLGGVACEAQNLRIWDYGPGRNRRGEVTRDIASVKVVEG